MRRVLLFAILAGCLGVGVLPALGADTTVMVIDNAFLPGQFAVKPGENVTWNNTNEGSSSHNLWIDGVMVVGDGSSWMHSDNTFAAREQPYPFRCSLHPGMSGRFYVNDAGVVPTPTPTPSPTVTASPSPSPSATPPATTPPPTGSAGVVVSRFTARLLRDHFCTRRSANCKRPGVFLTLDLGATDTVRVRGTLTRAPLAGGRSRRFATVSFLVRPGRRQVKLPSRKRLTRGRYTLALKAGGLERRLRFRVVR